MKAPAELEPLLRRLLGSVRVVASAADVPADIPAALTYVTRDGIVARGDGSVEFWAPGENESNPLAREHQLAEWQEDLDRLRKDVGEKRTRADALQQDETAGREALDAAQISLETHRREMALAEGEIRMVEREAKQARERAETIGWELETLVQKTGAGTQRRTAMAGEMEAIRMRQVGGAHAERDRFRKAAPAGRPSATRCSRKPPNAGWPCRATSSSSTGCGRAASRWKPASASWRR